MIWAVILFLIGFSALAIQTLNDETEAEKRKEVEGKRLYQEYQKAISSGDKSAALQAGRAYHSHMRGGSLTLMDEQQITNDLSTM